MTGRHDKLENFPFIRQASASKPEAPIMLTLQKSYTKGLLTLLTHRETSEAPAYFVNGR